MDDEYGWQLLPKPPKRLKTTTTCFDKCIFCQTSNDVLRVAKPPSIEKVITAIGIRQDELSQRLSPNDLRDVDGKVVLWHSSCYERYTSKQNLRYCATQSADNVQTERKKRGVLFDWESKCIFCKNATRKKDRQLINIVTYEACNSIKESAEAREDDELLTIIQSVTDLISAGGKYHKACHASYVSKTNIQRKHNTSTEENIFEEAFKRLLEIITPEIENGKAYDMNVLLTMFQKEVEKMGGAATSYTKQKLKVRLIGHYKELVVFHQPPQKTKPEIVYSSSISLLDVINAASDCPSPARANYHHN